MEPTPGQESLPGTEPQPGDEAQPGHGSEPEQIPEPEQVPEPAKGTQCEAAARVHHVEHARGAGHDSAGDTLNGPAAGTDQEDAITPLPQPELSLPQRLPATFSRPGTKATVLLTVGIVPLLLLVAALRPSGFWWTRLIAGLVVLAAGVVIARIVLVAIVAKPDRLVIRNLRNTHRIPWSQVAEIFETPPPPPSVYRDNPLYRREIDLLVGLTDGSVISATLYSHRLFQDDHSSRKEVIDRLNELRRQLSPQPGGESSVADKGPDLLS